MAHNLPVELTSFVGRDEDVRDVGRQLRERRLVTLTGVGGCGKSRLAARVAAGMADEQPDGVWWFDLGSVADPDLVARSAAATLGVLVEPASDPLPTLVSNLRDQRVLLCLDTCEHLLDATAALAEAVLTTCPRVSVLATSREPLGVMGEVVWRVASLKDTEAVALFGDRAELVAPGFSVQAHHADVHAVCRRLDGLPLAVELAAAWVRALSPAQIADGLEDSFRLLAGGPRGALPRHQTLVASMDWSHDRLAEDEQMLLRRLSVFLGSFTLDGIRAVCTESAPDSEDALNVLGRLVDKSLVAVRRAGPEVRYRLLDTVRQYAGERLRAAGEVARFRDRHLDHYLDLVERAEPELERDQDFWREHLESHHDDIAAALQWSLSTPVAHDRGRRLAAAMARQWFVRGQAHEGLGFLTEASQLAPDDRSTVQGRLLCGLAMLGMVGGRRDLVGEAATSGLELATENGDDRTRARCLIMIAYGHFFRDFEQCQATAAEAHAIAEAAGDPFARDWAQVIEAYSVNTRDRHAESVVLARKAYEQSLSRGDRFCAAFALSVELYAAMYSDLPRAVPIAREVIELVAPLGDYFAVGTNVANVALVRARIGDLAGARQIMEPIVRSLDESPDVDVVGFQISYGLIHLWAGDLEDAVRWFRRATDQPPGVDDWTATRCLAGLATALRLLGRPQEAQRRADHGVQLARRFGSPLNLAEGLDEQARLAADADPARAFDLHHEALAARREWGLRTFYPDSLDALAMLAIGTHRFVEGVRMLGSSDAARSDMSYPRPPVAEPAVRQAMSAARAVLDDEEFERAWADGQAMPLEDAVAAASRGRGRRNRPPTGWASLTPTELEVVRLVVAGYTNPKIASQLFVSGATVKTHLSHIFSKLGIANRTELATFASGRLEDLGR